MEGEGALRGQEEEEEEAGSLVNREVGTYEVFGEMVRRGEYEEDD